MYRHALVLVTLAFASTPAFADKILNAGEFYTSRSAGERVVCMGAPAQPETQSFLAEGETMMSADEARDGSACTGVMDSSTGAMLRAKNIAESNGRGIQCPQGYSCEVQAGAMQYRRHGNVCAAYMPFLATRR